MLDLTQQNSGNFINKEKKIVIFLKSFLSELGPSRGVALTCEHSELPAGLSKEDSH